MTDDTYTPPEVWTEDDECGGTWRRTNRPTAGATHEAELPVGKHPFQLYSEGTPNGQKVTIMFEELLAAGHDAEYDAWLIDIGTGAQFGSGFVEVNPNSKIPAMVDRSGDVPVNVFESGNILLHLAEKFGAFLPAPGPERTEVMNWLFWLQGSAPFMGGGFGHFYAYAPKKWKYPIDRYAMEVKRQMDVLNNVLANRRYIAGDDYSIADMAIWPWYGDLAMGRRYNAGKFLGGPDYTHVRRWAEEVEARPAVSRGRMVNRTGGDPRFQLRERHDASDFEFRTQDKLEAESAA